VKRTCLAEGDLYGRVWSASLPSSEKGEKERKIAHRYAINPILKHSALGKLPLCTMFSQMSSMFFVALCGVVEFVVRIEKRESGEKKVSLTRFFPLKR
jgi:hypothetical protein